MQTFALVLMSAAAANAATPFVSGSITSKETFLYGKFRAKVTSPGTKGSCVGFFTMFNGAN